MGRALAGRAVAEERDGRLAGAAQRRRQGGAAGVGEAGADDAVAAEDVEREIGDVHRAAEPLAVAGALAEHLGHHPPQVRTRGDQVPVRAVVPDEVVRLAHHAGGADGDRLLADAAVGRAEDHTLLEELGCALLEDADQAHPPVLLDQVRGRSAAHGLAARPSVRGHGSAGASICAMLLLDELYHLEERSEEDVLLADRVAFVTGAGSGIGREIAELFAREGARIASLRPVAEAGVIFSPALEAAGAREPLFVHGDVREPADVERAMDTVVAAAGRIDILVNCAGVREIGDVYTMPAEEWENVIAINLSGTFYCCQSAARRMRESGGGSIVNMASVGGLIGLSHRPAYTAAKHGIVGLTKSLARDLAPAGIRVNALCPGVIRTPLTEQYFTDERLRAGARRLGAARALRRRRATSRRPPSTSRATWRRTSRASRCRSTAAGWPRRASSREPGRRRSSRATRRWATSLGETPSALNPGDRLKPVASWRRVGAILAQAAAASSRRAAAISRGRLASSTARMRPSASVYRAAKESLPPSISTMSQPAVDPTICSRTPN